jgi:hypothetical protein
MLCEEFEIRFHGLLDRRVRPETDASLCAHAQTCPECSALLETQELLFSGLSALRPAAPRDISLDVLAAVQTPVRPADSVRWSVARRWFPWVAAACLMISAGAFVLRGLQLPTRPESLATTQIVVQPAHPVSGTHLLKPEYAKLVRDTGESLAFALCGSGDSSQTAPAAAQPAAAADWFEEVTNGIRPLTRSVEEALDALRQSIPGGPTKSS